MRLFPQKHNHYPGCRYNGLPVVKAWRLHFTYALLGLAFTCAALYLVVALIAWLVTR